MGRRRGHDERSGYSDGSGNGSSYSSRFTSLVGVSGLAEMEGVSSSRRKSRRGSLARGLMGMSSLANSLKRNSRILLGGSSMAIDPHADSTVLNKVYKARSWAQTALANSSKDKKRIRKLLISCAGESVIRELRTWPLTLSPKGYICVHGLSGAVVDLRGCSRLAPITVLGANLDLSDSQHLEVVDAADTEGKLILRGCTSLRRMPLSMTVGSLNLTDCDRIMSLPRDLHVGGDLELCRCKNLVALPSSLRRVPGSLVANGCEQLDELPGQLVVGKHLILSYCTSLTEIACSYLEVGEDLILEGCSKLESLPQEGLAVRGVVNLRDCVSLVELPMHLRLTRLDVTGCVSLKALPDNLRVSADLDAKFCTALEKLPENLEVGGSLDLTGCTSLEALPRNLIVRGDLYLSGCERITTLPASLVIGGDLHLENCTGITSLPDFVFGLGTSEDPISYGDLRNIYIIGTGLPESELISIRDGYHQGIQFHSSVDHQLTDRRFKFETMDEALEAWQFGDVVVPHDFDPAYEFGVRGFLEQLRMAKEFEAEESREFLISRVHEVLDLLFKDPSSRAEIATRMSDSVDTCGDKPIWALNQMLLTSFIVKARGNREALRALGRRVMNLGVVHDHAMRKIKSVNFVDDVCVYLSFEIKLRKDLDLPVSASEMLFPNIVPLSKEELKACVRDAKSIDADQYEAWLLTWPEWQRQLRLEAVVPYDEIAGYTYLDTEGFTNLREEPANDPVLLNNSVWSYKDVVEKWVATGTDLNNTPWPAQILFTAIARVKAVPPPPSSPPPIPARSGRDGRRRIKRRTLPKAAPDDEYRSLGMYDASLDDVDDSESAFSSFTDLVK